MAYPLLGELNHDFHGFRLTKPLTFLLEEPNHEIINNSHFQNLTIFETKQSLPKPPFFSTAYLYVYQLTYAKSVLQNRALQEKKTNTARHGVDLLHVVTDLSSKPWPIGMT